ncbi:MAG: hypothetical protein JO060_02250 [Candidatus Eremiobacteraeota bacterium]|nr:hypothetical protein [Candidatus Eremiobacteraeota bacterium]
MEQETEQALLVTVRCPECGTEQQIGADRTEWCCNSCMVRHPVGESAESGKSNKDEGGAAA